MAHATPGTNVSRYLQGCSFPCRKSDILRHARDMKADAKVIGQLNRLPEQQFRSIDEVTKSLGSQV